MLAVLALVVVNALAQSPWGTFSLATTIPIAFFIRNDNPCALLLIRGARPARIGL